MPEAPVDASEEEEAALRDTLLRSYLKMLKHAVVASVIGVVVLSSLGPELPHPAVAPISALLTTIQALKMLRLRAQLLSVPDRKLPRIQRPVEPPGILPPSFVEPTHPAPPRLALPAEPPRHISGGWTRCRVCNRVLSDPESRHRGVGPDCFRRTGLQYPPGPSNPQHAQWRVTVDVISKDHARKLEAAAMEWQAMLAEAKRSHAQQVTAWEQDADRARRQEEFEQELDAWVAATARLEEERAARGPSPCDEAARHSGALGLTFGWSAAAYLLVPLARGL